jgi:hypothetical protein
VTKASSGSPSGDITIVNAGTYIVQANIQVYNGDSSSQDIYTGLVKGGTVVSGSGMGSSVAAGAWITISRTFTVTTTSANQVIQLVADCSSSSVQVKSSTGGHLSNAGVSMTVYQLAR